MADYRAMWEGLGMDVNTHDLLCEALPQAFGDVYLSQGNRPEGMDYFNNTSAPAVWQPTCPGGNTVSRSPHLTHF